MEDLVNLTFPANSFAHKLGDETIEESLGGPSKHSTAVNHDIDIAAAVLLRAGHMTVQMKVTHPPGR